MGRKYYMAGGEAEVPEKALVSLKRACCIT